MDTQSIHEKFPIGHATSTSVAEIRDVWAILSRGHTTVRKIAKELGTSARRTHYIVKFLEQCGYVEHRPRETGWTVKVKFVEVNVVHQGEQP